MKRASTIFLKVAIVCMAVGVIGISGLLLSVWGDIAGEFPGRAYAVYTVFTAMLVAAVPFFVGLYGAGRLLGYIDKGMPFTKQSAGAVKIIALSTGCVSAIYVIALPFFFIWAKGVDAPGLMVIGTLLAGGPMVVAVFASLLYRLITEAADLKIGSELTV